jgi:hypothetical protein
MPLVPRRVALDIAGAFEIVEPSQVISSLFISEATTGAPYYVRLGQAQPAGPFFGRGLTIRLGDGVPMRERSEGVWIVVQQGEETPNGLVVVQVAFTGAGK